MKIRHRTIVVCLMVPSFVVYSMKLHHRWSALEKHGEWSFVVVVEEEEGATSTTCNVNFTCTVVEQSINEPSPLHTTCKQLDYCILRSAITTERNPPFHHLCLVKDRSRFTVYTSMHDPEAQSRDLRSTSKYFRSAIGSHIATTQGRDQLDLQSVSIVSTV